ncbi:UDP-glucose 4-epimerase [Monaibacterium marinum]|uniref:UDP-glucose 4-epimerase n=1 Tax=Pontivivens marinum TaxID=1690039 RepID=A0A2C9CVZ7_9RHOB|nr:UDP-glucose 4-epimerase GalE [Monaibacterium marinum]SOH95442.1 UDP-glucose 4-epimerase [Monaibacterium marinum]
MANILVTGGAGYIGSHACKALAKAGHVPIAYDNLVTGWEEAVRFGPFERGDLHSGDRLDEVFAKWQPEAVMHFAALSNVGEASREPGLYWRNNVGGSMGLLDAMAKAGCRRIVFSSTCATYGDRDGVVLDEQAGFAPLNAYGASKAAVEAMLADYGRAYDIAHVSFRYFNVAGADVDGEIGEAHDPETHLIPLALQAATGRRGALTLFGTDYPTPDGTCIRDYVHVEDLVAAHILGLDHLARGGVETAFNLGTGRGFSVREVVSAVARVTGLQVPMIEGARREGDAVALVSGSTLAGEVLGWQAERSTLDAMIGSAFAWHQKGTVYKA